MNAYKMMSHKMNVVYIFSVSRPAAAVASILGSPCSRAALYNDACIIYMLVISNK